MTVAGRALSRGQQLKCDCPGVLPREHPDRIHVAYDDHRLMANAGLILPVTLAGGPPLADIGDADALRAGGTEQVLGCVVKVPSTLGTFLRSFWWGHVR